MTAPATDVKFELTTPAADNKDYTISTDANVVTVNVAEGTESVKITVKGAKEANVTEEKDFVTVNGTVVTIASEEKNLDKDNTLTFTLAVTGADDKVVNYTVKIIVAAKATTPESEK